MSEWEKGSVTYRHTVLVQLRFPTSGSASIYEQLLVSDLQHVHMGWQLRCYLGCSFQALALIRSGPLVWLPVGGCCTLMLLTTTGSRFFQGRLRNWVANQSNAKWSIPAHCAPRGEGGSAGAEHHEGSLPLCLTSPCWQLHCAGETSDGRE